MTGVDETALQRIASNVILREAGAHGDAAAIAVAFTRAHEKLAHVATPLIGAVGVEVLTRRAVHLARLRYPWLNDTEADPANRALTPVLVCVKEQHPASAAECAAAVLASLGNLLVTMIGEALTLRLLRQAWPAGFVDPEK